MLSKVKNIGVALAGAGATQLQAAETAVNPILESAVNSNMDLIKTVVNTLVGYLLVEAITFFRKKRKERLEKQAEKTV